MLQNPQFVILTASLALAVPSHAACIGGNSTCTSFDPTSSSQPTLISGFGDPQSIAGLDRVRILFTVSNYVGPSFNLTNIIVQGNNFSTPFGPTAAGSVTIPSNGGTGLFSTVELLGYTFPNGSTSTTANSKLSFTIPAGLSNGTTIVARTQYVNSDLTRIETSSLNPFTTVARTPVPGPLPLLGAGAAFTFSRKLRRRVKSLV